MISNNASKDVAGLVGYGATGPTLRKFPRNFRMGLKKRSTEATKSKTEVLLIMSDLLCLQYRQLFDFLKAIERMKTEFVQERRKGTKGIITEEEINVEFISLDLASLVSVMAFVDDFRTSGRKLHVLICNAGLIHEQLEYTEDGNEYMFQVNYLGHLLLAIKLLPVMMQSGDDLRIVNNSSMGHEYTDFELEKIQGRDSFQPWDFYNKSKGYQVLQMYAMNRKLCQSDVTVNCIHPGLVRTNFNQNFPGGITSWIVRCMWYCGCSKSTYAGAQVLIDTAINPKYRGRSNLYLSEDGERETKAYTRKRENQEALWKYSIERLGKFLTEEDLSIFDNEK